MVARIRAVGVEVVAADRLRDLLGLEIADRRQTVEDGDHDVGGVDLEVASQRGPRVREAVAVGTERRERPRHEARDLVGYRLHEVGDRDDRAFAVLRAARSTYATRGVSSGCSRFHRSTLERVLAEQLVARRAPHVGGDVVLVEQHLLRVERGEHRRPAGQDLRPLLRRSRRGLVAVQALDDPLLDAGIARHRGHRRSSRCRGSGSRSSPRARRRTCGRCRHG